MNIVPNWYGKLTITRVFLMSIPCIILGCMLLVTGFVDARVLAVPPINLSTENVVLENDMYVEVSKYSVAAVLDILDSDQMCFLIEYQEGKYFFVIENKDSSAYDSLCFSAHKSGQVVQKSYVIEGRTSEFNDKIYSKAIESLKKPQYSNIALDGISKIEVSPVLNDTSFRIAFGTILTSVGVLCLIYSLLRLICLRKKLNNNKVYRGQTPSKI